MPYFERWELLQKTLQSFEERGYHKKKIQLIIVDDGSMNEPIPDNFKWRDVSTKVGYLPMKKHYLNPCLPLNLAVRMANAPVVLLTSPENSHPVDNLCDKVVGKVQKLKDVVLICTKEGNLDSRPMRSTKGWYTHPKHNPDKKFWWSQLMHITFFEMVGGFDVSFRHGLGHDDDQFSHALTIAGANWIYTDPEKNYAVHHHNRTCQTHKKGIKSNRERWLNYKRSIQTPHDVLHLRSE